MPFTSKIRDIPERSEYKIGFPRGVNTVQNASLIHDKNLVTATNVVISVDGIKPRPGSKKVWDEGSASYVYGSGAFYKNTDGSRKYVRMANAQLQYLNVDTWTAIGATAYTAGDMCFVQARDKLFTYNGTDALTYYDGSTITTYTTVNTPTSLAVAAQGTTGSTAYSYQVTAFNETGETAGATAVAIANGNATLDSTNYNQVTWDTMTGADGYNIWGRTATGYGEVYLATVYGNSTTTYNDTGTDTPDTTRLTPTANTTGGLKAKFAVFTQGRQWAAGATEGSTYYPTRIYYSGTLDYVDAFVGGEYGGGWVEVESNDGGEIVGIKPYQSGIIVLKTNGVFKVYFTTSGAIAVEEITKSHGGVSFRGAQIIDNDIVYIAQKDNQIEVYTLGQQANYVSSIIRTNNITVFISDQLSTVNRAKFSNICSFYYKDKFGFAYTSSGATENDTMWVLDVRFGGWVKWTGLPAEVNHFSIYDDGTNKKLYGGSNADGYMIEMFTTTKNDNDSAYTKSIQTKHYNGKQFDIEKIWRNPVLWFKYIQGGAISAEVWSDGTRRQGTAVLSSTTSGAGAGSDKAGAFLAGHMITAVPSVTLNADTPKELTGIFFGRSIRFDLTDTEKNSDWVFMGIHLIFTPLVGKPLASEFRHELT